MSELLLRCVCLDHAQGGVVVEISPEWLAVVLNHDVCEHVGVGFGEGLPVVLHVGGSHSPVVVLVIQSAEHEAVLIQPTQVEGHEGAVSKGVYVPANVTLEVGLGEDPVAAVHHVEDHVLG